MNKFSPTSNKLKKHIVKNGKFKANQSEVEGQLSSINNHL
jgi:hypothetical protein